MIKDSLKTNDSGMKEAIVGSDKNLNRQILEKVLKAESALVNTDSMSVLKEFENQGYED